MTDGTTKIVVYGPRPERGARYATETEFESRDVALAYLTAVIISTTCRGIPPKVTESMNRATITVDPPL